MCKNKKFKIAAMMLVGTLLMSSLSGCSLVPVLNLTEEESRIIAEYSAGLLLKYDKDYKGNLLELKEEEEDQLEIVNEPVPSEEVPEENTDISSSDGSSSDKNKADVTYTDVPIAEVLGLNGFEVTYSSMETAIIYPEQTGEMVFSMQAQQGMELLVLHFNVTNTGENENLCDVLRKDAMYRILINGSERVANLRTILLNDFSQYHENIAGFGMADTVLIFEIGEGQSQSIDTLDLIINYQKQNSTYKIK